MNKEAIERLSKLAPNEVVAMAFTKKALENEFKSQTPNLISWWCLCYYLAKIENKNGLLNHEKVKLKGLLKKLMELKFKGSDTPKMKRSILENLWIDGFEYASNPNAVVAEFMTKFDKEGIEENEELYNNIAKCFGNNVSKLIDLICGDDYAKIASYVETTF